MAEYSVDFSWDPEADVWFATSNDIPGLVLEGGSLDALFERVKFAAPELLALNGVSGDRVAVNFLSERRELVTV